MSRLVFLLKGPFSPKRRKTQTFYFDENKRQKLFFIKIKRLMQKSQDNSYKPFRVFLAKMSFLVKKIVGRSSVNPENKNKN
jgi:hypothetical protein